MATENRAMKVAELFERAYEVMRSERERRHLELALAHILLYAFNTPTITFSPEAFYGMEDAELRVFESKEGGIVLQVHGLPDHAPQPAPEDESTPENPDKPTIH